MLPTKEQPLTYDIRKANELGCKLQAQLLFIAGRWKQYRTFLTVPDYSEWIGLNLLTRDDETLK